MSSLKYMFGSTHTKMYVYVNKDDANIFGVLEAGSFLDARRHLGNTYYIKQVWLRLDELPDLFDKDARWSIVSSVLGERL